MLPEFSYLENGGFPSWNLTFLLYATILPSGDSKELSQSYISEGTTCQNSYPKEL